MSDPAPAFLVNAHNDPVLVKIQGKACFQNCSPLKEFVQQMLDQGRRNIVIDFSGCTGMDSTFLGILAGAGISMMRSEVKGEMILARLSPRNLELVCNLGLNRIVTVDADESVEVSDCKSELKGDTAKSKEAIENARMVLGAHENLVEIDAANKAKFQDVIAFLKNQVDALE